MLRIKTKKGNEIYSTSFAIEINQTRKEINFQSFDISEVLYFEEVSSVSINKEVIFFNE